jgi:hypothetical protein
LRRKHRQYLYIVLLFQFHWLPCPKQPNNVNKPSPKGPKNDNMAVSNAFVLTYLGYPNPEQHGGADGAII